MNLENNKSIRLNVVFLLLGTMLTFSVQAESGEETEAAAAAETASSGTTVAEVAVSPMGQAVGAGVAGGLIWGVNGAVIGSLLGASSGMSMEAAKEGRTVVSQEEFDSTQMHQQQAAQKFNNRQSGTVNRVQASGKVYQN
ncbi:MAG: hypothetical protein KZQ58_06690 [gamma proteobacterium symbiont of Bathyaustriella thionipta]|nr:hypothetical protein [gamma proteobacterium symbiont of Bathyaustriella thionipta]